MDEHPVTLRGLELQMWQEEYREAIAAANRFVAEYGLSSDELRQF